MAIVSKGEFVKIEKATWEKGEWDVATGRVIKKGKSENWWSIFTGTKEEARIIYEAFLKVGYLPYKS